MKRPHSASLVATFPVNKHSRGGKQAAGSEEPRPRYGLATCEELCSSSGEEGSCGEGEVPPSRQIGVFAQCAPPGEAAAEGSWLKSPHSTHHRRPPPDLGTPAPAAVPAGLQTPTLRKVLSFSSWMQPIATQPVVPQHACAVDVNDIAVMLARVGQGRQPRAADPQQQLSTLDELLEKLDSGGPIEWDTDVLSDSEEEEEEEEEPLA